MGKIKAEKKKHTEIFYVSTCVFGINPFSDKIIMWFVLLTFGDGVLSGLLLLQLKFVGMLSLFMFSLLGDLFIDRFSATLLLKFDGDRALLRSWGPIASPDLRLGLA